MTTKAKAAKNSAKPKGGKAKSPGLMAKLKNALTKKPAAKPAAKAPAKPVAKAPVKAAKPATKTPTKTPAKTPAKVAAKASPAARKPAPAAKTAKAASMPARSTAPVRRALNASAGKPFKHLTSEDQVRRMSDKDYMNDAQLDFFRQRLLQQRQEVLDRQTEVKDRLNQHESFADPADRATAEEEHWLDLRLRERESMLLRKIDEALRRIENREYGYCEKTGDAIGIPRLLARPTATVCVDVKGQDERVEAQFRDR